MNMVGHVREGRREGVVLMKDEHGRSCEGRRDWC